MVIHKIIYLEYQQEIYEYLNPKVRELIKLPYSIEDVESINVRFIAYGYPVKVNILWWINFCLMNKPDFMLSELVDFKYKWKPFMEIINGIPMIFDSY